MAGPRVTEVSLTLYAVIARAGAIRPLQEVLSLARILPGSWRTNLCSFGFRPAYRNVPDECVFCFQGAREDLAGGPSALGEPACLSSQGVADEKAPFVAVGQNFFEKIWGTWKKPPTFIKNRRLCVKCVAKWQKIVYNISSIT